MKMRNRMWLSNYMYVLVSSSSAASHRNQSSTDKDKKVIRKSDSHDPILEIRHPTFAFLYIKKTAQTLHNQ